MLPREKACPHTQCGRRWKSKPATASYCPNKWCQYLLVDLRPGDENSNSFKGEHFQCLTCPHPATEFLASPKKINRSGLTGYDWSALECPECSYKLREALKKSGLSGEEFQEKYRELTQMYVEWLSYGWWLPPREVEDKVYAKTFTATPVRVDKETWIFPRRQDKPIHVLKRIEHGPYTTACLPESE